MFVVCLKYVEIKPTVRATITYARYGGLIGLSLAMTGYSGTSSTCQATQPLCQLRVVEFYHAVLEQTPSLSIACY